MGLRDDPKTSRAYPSINNDCFYCKSPVAPKIEHQVAYCLTGRFRDCPVYKQLKGSAFPARLRANGAAFRPRRFFLKMMMFLSVAVGIVVALQRFQPSFPGTVGSPLGSPVRAPSRTVAGPPSDQAPTGVTQLPAASQIPFTKTAGVKIAEEPPAISKAFSHALDIPFQVGNRTFLIHRIQSGEAFEILANGYRTSVESIQALNYGLKTPLRVNHVIVICPDSFSVDLSLPAFTTYEITDHETTIDEVARNFNIEADLLRYYNGCSDNCHLMIGDWLIIPQAE
ncbi:hypothetical protein EHM76_07355 [bacterium]|nr:MAG: hypothetical protein EHM76_07355 [bacterium]